MGAFLAALLMLLQVAPARPACRRGCAAARMECVAERGAPANEVLAACGRVYETARRACGRTRECRRTARIERRACAAAARSELAVLTAPCAQDRARCRACCRGGGDRSACVTTSTTIPRQPCDVGDPQGTPSVTFTGTQPGDGIIHGVVSNVNTQALRIVGWAQQDRWYAQPTAAELSCADGSFSLTTNPWKRFVLLLVDGRYRVLAGQRIDRHPSIGDGVIAWAEYPEPTERVTVGTTRFFKKTSNGLATGPGPCPFADENAVQEAAGVVRLRVAPVGGTWSCAELYAETPLGHGRYRIKVTGRLDTLPRPLVFADFLFRSLTAEVDVECSEALTGIAGRCQAVVQPFHLPDHIRYFDMPAVSETTHEIVWTPDSVSFRVWKGHQDEPAGGDVLIEWHYAGAYVPAEDGDPLLYRINLWLFGGAAPGDGLPREIAVSDFTFTAR